MAAPQSPSSPTDSTPLREGWRRVEDCVAADLRIPDIDGERCVHSMAEQASCRACVDSCPRDAWQLDDDGLNLDTLACDGCGLCAPACPQGALYQDREILHGNWHGRHVAVVACEYAGIRPGPGMLPCLHTLGQRELLRLHRSGVTHLVSCSGDCDRCIRHSTTPLSDHLNRVNHWLGSRAQTPLTPVRMAPAQWQHVADTLSDAAGEVPTLSRRAFFRAGLDTGARVLGFDRDQRERFLAAGELLGELPGTPDEKAAMPFVPHIDATRCSACHACSRLCPRGAIEQVEDLASSAYALHPASCTGCQLCSDICDRNAITVARDTAAAYRRIELEKHQCRRCGVAFFRTVDSRADGEDCTICAQTNHHGRLYQVY